MTQRDHPNNQLYDIPSTCEPVNVGCTGHLQARAEDIPSHVTPTYYMVKTCQTLHVYHFMFHYCELGGLYNTKFHPYGP